jgi:hypothetical protein
VHELAPEALQVPARQSGHTVVRPVKVLAVPDSQLVQMVNPVTDAYFPEPQLVQSATPAEALNVPVKQFAQAAPTDPNPLPKP